MKDITQLDPNLIKQYLPENLSINNLKKDENGNIANTEENVKMLIQYGIIKSDENTSFVKIVEEKNISVQRPLYNQLYMDSISGPDIDASDYNNKIHDSKDLPAPADVGAINPYFSTSEITQSIVILRQIFMIQKDAEISEASYSQKLIKSIINNLSTKQDTINKILESEIRSQNAIIVSASVAIAAYSITAIAVLTGISKTFGLKKPIEGLDNNKKTKDELDVEDDLEDDEYELVEDPINKLEILLSPKAKSENKDRDGSNIEISLEPKQKKEVDEKQYINQEVKVAYYEKQKDMFGVLKNDLIVNQLISGIDHLSEAIKSGLNIENVGRKPKALQKVLDTEMSLSFKSLDESSSSSYEDISKSERSLLRTIMKLSSMTSKISGFILRV